VPNYLEASLLSLAGVLAVFLILRLAVPVFVIVYAPPVAPAVPGTLRIACVGDSITYGTLVRGRRTNCYPAQLGRFLGPAYSVRNFGANGRAIQKGADLPYWKHKYFRLSSEFNPDIVLIMLGTNDSRKPNWKGLDQYLRDYRNMLLYYRSLSPKSSLYALTPPTEFVLKNKKAVKYGMNKKAIDEMTAGIKTLSAYVGVEVIDINAATASRPEHFSFDGIHANAAGAKHIAETVYMAIRGRRPGDSMQGPLMHSGTR
jgi:acyl-CoA thioesterase I